jgi:predicted nucleotidyltransferase
MDKRSLEIARQLKKEIEKDLNVIDMRIFGSHARDDFEEDSDLDIFIELEKNNPEIRKLIDHLSWEIAFENDLIIMTLIHSKDEVENGIYKYTPIYKSIVRDGIVV